MLNNPFIALFLTFSAAILWLRINDFAAHRGWIESRLSRKLIHIGTGPIFVLCWLLFPDLNISRYLAALVPLLITVQFALIGIGVIKDEAAVKAMSRSGDRREILYGPLFYGVIFVLLTLVYWTSSPIGVAALMVLCGGDGLAAVLGRFFGRKLLPWSDSKTWMGTAGMFAGSWTMAAGVFAVYILAGIFPGPLSAYFLPLTLISAAATIVESLPFREIDNITTTATALVIGHILF